MIFECIICSKILNKKDTIIGNKFFDFYGSDYLPVPYCKKCYLEEKKRYLDNKEYKQIVKKINEVAK
jgi:hypothetical protein